MEGSLVETHSILEAGYVLPPGRRIPTGELWAGNLASFVRKLTHEKTLEIPKLDVAINDPRKEYFNEFFEYSNFRLPLSTFLVNVLKYYRINLSQLLVIAAAKVSHFEIMCRVHNIEPTVGLFRCFYVNSKNKGRMSFSKRPDSDVVCYTKPLDSLKHWNDHFLWLDSFACLASFPWHADKNVSRDHFPKSTEFNADDYAILVANPAPFQKFSEPFLCLVGMSRYYTLDKDTYPSFLHDDKTDMDLFAFIQVADPTKVKVGERERIEGEARLLDSTIRRVVSLLPVVPARPESELEASVNSHGVKIITDENVVTKKPRRPRKKRPAVTDASGSSHPPKKLQGDYGTSSGAATGGKSPSVLKELLASSMLNVEVGVAAVATLPLVTSSVSVMPEHESDAPTDSIIGLNLRTIGASERFVISLDSSHHSSTHASGAEGDSIIKSAVIPSVMTEAVVTSHAVNAPSVPVPKMGAKVTSPVHASMFLDSDSIETVKADAAVFVPQWNVLNNSLLDDSDVSREFVDHLAPPALFSQIREIDYHHLFTELNVRTACQACLNAEVRMRTEYCLSERKRLESECEKQADLLKAKDNEVENLKAQLLLKETKAAKASRLRAQVFAAEAIEKMHADEIDALKQRNVSLENEKDSLDGKVAKLQSSVAAKDLKLKDLNVVVHALETTCSGLRGQVSGYERLKEQIEEFQDAQKNIINDKVAKLDADLLEMTLHLEEKFYPHLLNIISGRSRAIEKGMQDGLSAGINHGKAGRSLTYIVSYNSAAEADYNFALQRLRVNIDSPH
ncbi:hypothetical protein Tco_0010978 [Tanacetum coccineum]